MAGPLYKYLVETYAPLEANLEEYLNDKGGLGWQLIEVDTDTRLFVFKQEVLPPGCVTLARLVWQMLVDALVRMTRGASS